MVVNLCAYAHHPFYGLEVAVACQPLRYEVLDNFYGSVIGVGIENHVLEQFEFWYAEVVHIDVRSCEHAAWHTHDGFQGVWMEEYENEVCMLESGHVGCRVVLPADRGYVAGLDDAVYGKWYPTMEHPLHATGRHDAHFHRVPVETHHPVVMDEGRKVLGRKNYT